MINDHVWHTGFTLWSLFYCIVFRSVSKSESDVYRRQILTSEVYLRSVGIKFTRTSIIISIRFLHNFFLFLMNNFLFHLVF